MGEAKETKKVSQLLEQGGECNKEGREMEDCLCLHLVDSLEAQEQEMF